MNLSPKQFFRSFNLPRRNQVTRSRLISLLCAAFVFSLLFAGTFALARAEKYNCTLKWGNYGIGDGQFDHPYDVTIDDSGNVYVADTYNHRVQKFTGAGTFLGAWGSYGTGNGQFNYSMGVAVDAAGNVYIADAGNHRIQKFSSKGGFLQTWGSYGVGDGQFKYPYDVTVD